MRSAWKWWALALAAVVVSAGFVLLETSRPHGSTAGSGSAVPVGLVLEFAKLSEGAAGTVAEFDVTYAASDVVADDIHFCYLNASDVQPSSTYDATLYGPSGNTLATYSSANATACVSGLTGLSSATVAIGGWTSGASAAVVVNDTVSLSVPTGYGQVLFSYWTSQAGQITSLTV